MKEKIVAKLDEHINRLLEKPELTNEEYFILHERLMEIKRAEEEAAHMLEFENRMARIMGMMNALGTGGANCAQ